MTAQVNALPFSFRSAPRSARLLNGSMGPGSPKEGLDPLVLSNGRSVVGSPGGHRSLLEREEGEEENLQRSLSAERKKHRALLLWEKEKRRKNQEDLAKFRWQKLLSRVSFQPPTADYYDRLPIKPGFRFFSSLLKPPRGGIEMLQLNLPETILFTDRIYHLRTLPTGFLSCSDDVNFFQFLKSREEGRNSSSSPLACAAGVLRVMGDTEDSMQKIVMDWVMFRQKMTGHEIRPGQMIQEFIRSPGGHPSVIRLFHQRTTRETAASYAYQIVATQSLKYPESELTKRCTVDFGSPGSLEVVKQTGAALRPLEDAAEHIAAYLSRGYHLRIDKIVLDFLKDEQGRLYFCGCKGFLLEEATIGLALRAPPSPTIQGFAPSAARYTVDLEDIARRKEELEDRKKGSFVRCRLCRLQYPNLELAHLVSVRMLMLFKMHAAKRVDLPMDTSHLKVTTSDLLSQSVRVCPYCYVMVTSEFLLVTMEKSMAEALNIPYREEALEEDPKHIIQLQFLPKALIQWRVLVHFQSIEGALDTGVGLTLQVKLHDYKTKFPLFFKPGEDLILHSLKGLYFFSNPKKSISRFLREFQAEFSLECESKVLMKGVSPILSDFPSSLSMGSALTEKKHISLFLPGGSSRCDLVTAVGLSCDHICDSKYLKTALTKVLDVYLPEEHYCNTDPLPVEWMEHFGEEPLHLSFEEDVSVDNYYMPALTTQEVKRMQDISSPYPAPLNQLFIEPAPEPVKPPSRSAAGARDNTEFSGLETEISILELYSSVQSFLDSRPEPTRKEVDSSASTIRKGSRKVYRRRRTHSSREATLPRRKDKSLSLVVPPL